LNVPYADEVTTHRRIVGEAVAANGGEIVDQRGEEVFALSATTELRAARRPPA
jgi:hypothetical protein